MYILGITMTFWIGVLVVLLSAIGIIVYCAYKAYNNNEKYDQQRFVDNMILDYEEELSYAQYSSSGIALSRCAVLRDRIELLKTAPDAYEWALACYIKDKKDVKVE